MSLRSVLVRYARGVVPTAVEASSGKRQKKVGPSMPCPCCDARRRRKRVPYGVRFGECL